VVIAIVALLVSIALPSVAVARRAAQAGVCMSNVRQLVLANETYAQDHRSYYAPGASDFLANLTRWHGSRAAPSQRFQPAGGTLAPYLGEGNAGTANLSDSAQTARRCPSFAQALRALESTGLGFERSCGGYGYNNAYVGALRRRISPDVWIVASDRSGAPASAFMSPAATAAFADSALAASAGADGVIEYSFIEPRYWPHEPGARPDPSIHFRHGRRTGPSLANVAWLDGHVSAERMTFTWSSGLYGGDGQQSRIGWFGEADDNSLFDYR
jgi:prepilin-type processing-associated H-X9-DG protein